MLRRSWSWAVLVVALAMVPVMSSVPRPSPARAGVVRPNIVVILTDDQSPDSIPHSPAVMPHFQAMVTNPADRWVRFTHAYLNVSLCCPSRATILSGRYDTHTA